MEPAESIQLTQPIESSSPKYGTNRKHAQYSAWTIETKLEIKFAKVHQETTIILRLYHGFCNDIYD